MITTQAAVDVLCYYIENLVSDAAWGLAYAGQLPPDDSRLKCLNLLKEGTAGHNPDQLISVVAGALDLKEKTIYQALLKQAKKRSQTLPGQGKRYARQKLTFEQVLKIRGLLAQGYKSAVVARQFGVHRQVIYFIKKGETWPEATLL